VEKYSYPYPEDTQSKELKSEHGKKEKKKTGFSTWLILILIVLGGLIFFLLDRESSEKPAQKGEELPVRPSTVSVLKRKLTSALAIVNNLDINGGSQYRDSMENINKELAFFSNAADLINQANASGDKEINDLGKQLSSKLQRVQIKEFPLLRKAYESTRDKNILEENTIVIVGGDGNRMVTFTNNLFSDHHNFVELNFSVEKMLQNLRFDRVNYKRAPNANIRAYFNLQNPRDSEIVNYIWITNVDDWSYFDLKKSQ